MGHRDGDIDGILVEILVGIYLYRVESCERVVRGGSRKIKKVTLRHWN